MYKNDCDFMAKKILLSGLQTPDCPVTEVIEDILQSLLLLHKENVPKNTYIKSAAQYILAYLQLGFGYMDHKPLFDYVLQEAGFSFASIAKLQMHNPMIVANPYQLRSIIGRWPFSAHNSHTITAAIADIIRHVENHDMGTFQYYTAKKDGTYTALYQLIISANGILFHDVFMNQFYQLKKR